MNADRAGKVDVALSIFGKPLQTLLCLASLFRHCEQEIGTVYFIQEAAFPKYDSQNLASLAVFHEKISLYQPEMWLDTQVLETSRLREKAYRHAVRYQYAWEQSSAPYLLIIHNDIMICDNIIQAMRDVIGGAAACGEIGQCWVCPAHEACIVEQVGLGSGQACTSETFMSFRPSFEQLKSLYVQAGKQGFGVRPAWATWRHEFHHAPWPLPECRVNEWCCLINMDVARKSTVPFGQARPFGSYMKGTDMGVAWFHDMIAQGHTMKHFKLAPAVKHWWGHPALFDEDLYHNKEQNAAQILTAEYPEELKWAQENVPELF